MAIYDWYKLWRGYLLVLVKGPNLARLLNLTAKEGIKIWDLNYGKDMEMVTVKIHPRDLKRLRPLLKKTGCRIKVKEKKGVPFAWRQGKRRKGLLVGMVLFCALLYFFSLHIWDIHIEGLEGHTSVSRKEIFAVLEKYGIKEGMRKKNLDLPELERILLLEIEELKWVGASIKGVYLDIQVVERLREPPKEEDLTVLVAAKDGLVINVLVLSGEALIREGDTVQKGQELITGKLEVPPEQNGEPAEGVLEVKPRGIVEALVWYESYAEAPLYEVQKRKTGNFARSFYLVIKGKEYLLWGPSASLYRNYEMEKIKHTFSWRNLRLPVELYSIYYREYEVDIQPVSPPEALKKARSQALKEVEAQLPKGAKINKRFINDFYFFELGKVGCRVMVETLEDIAVPKVFGAPEEGKRRDVFS